VIAEASSGYRAQANRCCKETLQDACIACLSALRFQGQRHYPICHVSERADAMQQMRFHLARTRTIRARFGWG
jgi:hypothetical protein